MPAIRRLTSLSIFMLCACGAPGIVSDAKAEETLTFIHLNDTYRVDSVEEGRRGGFSRVATLVRGLRAQGNDVRILHGGDFLYPSLESQLWNGEQMVEAMNFLDDLAPMYVVPGNHEFDSRTPAVVIERIRESRFDWIADNMRLESGEVDVDRKLLTGFTFMAGDKKIGIVALTVHPDHGGNTRDYTPFDSGYVEHAERVIEQFEAEGVALIIGLTHLHLVTDIELAKLKARHPTFAFIVGGHDHEPEFQAGNAESAIIMKGGSNARTIWQIDVQFTDDAPEVITTRIDVDESIALDTEYQVIADKWRTKLLGLMPFLPSRVGYAAVPLDGREAVIRNEDSNWGMFIADQMRTAFRSPPADLAFVNGGTLRIDDYIAEDITFEDIGRTFGFSSYLRHMTMDGADFRRTLEAGYRGIGPGKGYFPQISGFRVCVDRGRPNGERIVQMQVPTAGGDWEEIVPGKAYSVVAPDFIYRGGDGYDFSQARDVSRPGSELKYLVLDAVIRAQAAGEKIGFERTPDNARFSILPASAVACFSE
jgi:2',3'-cyclic-nucleotide 2'-phosphodiesterase (5'-nucleotidase family)